MMYLLVNNGSSSKKYALSDGEKMLHTVFIENNKSSAQKFLAGRANIADIKAVGLRVVAPGAFFAQDRAIDDAYVARLASVAEYVPLHIKPALEEIALLKKELPGVLLYSISDSAFHQTMPAVARRYTLPQEIADRYELYRWGYHGISTRAAVRAVTELVGATPDRMVVCHLGSGSSITAVKNGKSIDTSMGFSPLEGMVMATRIGAIDAGAVLTLAKKSGMTLDELEEFFNTKCGLLGLSGREPGIKELIDREAQGDEGAKLALEAFVYAVQKYIGAYAAVLGGIDTLVFTGTIGERSSIMRDRICNGLQFLDIKNIHAIPTDEMSDMARRLAALIK